MAIAELPPQSARHDRESAGLRFERYFTRDGVHPYDAIDWERRDAVIPGEGGNVFEQKGVEVPAFWSMTATNVVASKYFRGKLGTPARGARYSPGARPGARRGWPSSTRATPTSGSSSGARPRKSRRPGRSASRATTWA